MSAQRIARPRIRVVGGVCAGVAEHLGLRVEIVRAAMCVLALCGGGGLLLYIWLWATTPVVASTSPLKASLTRPTEGGRVDSTRPSAPIVELLLGAALLLAAGGMIASRLGVDIPLGLFIPAIVIMVGLGFAWLQFNELRRGQEAGRSALVARGLGGLALMVLGIVLFFVTGDKPNIWTVFVAAAAVLLGVGIVVTPWVLRMARDLADERAERVRNAERAEVAAHLHDSVLQTLALIQQKAAPGSDASRLARAQERELRDWLFAEKRQQLVDLAEEIRRVAATIEHDFAVRIDVITVGAPVDRAPEALVAAAREAMLNAAEHAGGTVTVYVETSPSRIELSVVDHGPGFDLADVPEERLGVRESILGRMRRIGGAARIQRGPGGTGTEVLLTLPLTTTDHEKNG